MSDTHGDDLMNVDLGRRDLRPRRGDRAADALVARYGEARAARNGVRERGAAGAAPLDVSRAGSCRWSGGTAASPGR